MFETIKNFFQEIRIDLDFPRYERQCRQEHEQQAERIFSTKQSNDEINKLISEIESHANTIYDDLIFNKKTEKENLRKAYDLDKKIDTIEKLINIKVLNEGTDE